MREKGFSLIELMITVIIIAVITIIAIPIVTEHGLKAKRAVVKGVLMDMQSTQENFFINNKSYAASLEQLNYASPLYVDDNGTSVLQANGYYQITLVATAFEYTISAVPLNSQIKDIKCGALSINNIGVRSPAACW